MALVFPNRVGESGTYHSATGTITLSGAAATGLITFAAAALAGRIQVGDWVGVAIKKAADPDAWAVWMASYTSGVLTLEEEEDAAGSLTDGDAVQVVATITRKAILWGLKAPAYQIDETYWNYSYSPPGMDWYSATQQAGFNLNYQYLYTTGAWASGFRPERVSFELYAPAGATNLPGFSFQYLDSWMVPVGDWAAADITGALTLGAWTEFDFAMAFGSNDLGGAWASSGESDSGLAAQWRLRRVRFYTP